MHGIIQSLSAMSEWLGVSSPQFAFLFALPFGIVAVSFVADALESAQQLQSSASRYPTPSSVSR